MAVIVPGDELGNQRLGNKRGHVHVRRRRACRDGRYARDGVSLPTAAHAERQSDRHPDDVWFAKRDGLPLRNDRDVTVRTETIVGASTYTEHGSFELTSLQPQH